MWTCPKCQQKFINKNHIHSCNDRSVEDFLAKKSIHTVSLFHYFVEEYKKLGEFVLHPAKSRIAFAAQIRFGYVHRLGKDFLDIVLTFSEPHENNLCFYRIGEVPGGKYFQHYLRLYQKEDINDEVISFMKLALEFGNRQHIK